MDEQKETKEKIDLFLKEYKELVEKHGVDFANYPFFMPAEKGEFKVYVQSTPVILQKENFIK